MLAIVSALRDEQDGLLDHLRQHRCDTVAGRAFHKGVLHGQPVVLVLSGIGKVAAAATASLLFDRFDVQAMLFTGVAGGLARHVNVGDVVVGTTFLQHDLDASPIFPRWEVPGTGRSWFEADAAWAQRLVAAVQRAVPDRRCHQGLIVSGDRFVSSATESATLQALLPDALAVDMESAAMAQGCADFARPLAVVRSISDRADDAAHLDFPRFLAEVAAPLSRAVVLQALADRPEPT